MSHPPPPPPRPRRPLGVFWATAFLLVACTGASAAEPPDPVVVGKKRLRAAEFEKRGAWHEAARLYDEILRRDRADGSARESYHRCVRRARQAARFADPVLARTLAKLPVPQALDTYEEVLRVIGANHPDRARAAVPALFQQGIAELRAALDDVGFRRRYLPAAKPEALSTFRARLSGWDASKAAGRSEARDQITAVLRAASREGLILDGPASSAVAMEFAAGACAALDEYSTLVTPGMLALLQAAMRGKIVGVGFDVAVLDDRPQIARVHPKGPAEEAGLVRGDNIGRINGADVSDLPAESIATRLLGEPGSVVEIELGDRRSFKLIRRHVAAPSIEAERIRLDDGTFVGYLRVCHFDAGTLAEIKEALAAFGPMGESPRGLILDLRGNPGGTFKSALAAADLFVPDGVHVAGQSPLRDFNRAFKVESPGGYLMPIVVLIDGDTASSAEVLAVALKEGRAGRAPTLLIGQPTYGKGSVQLVIPLDKAPLDRLAAVRMTVARLLSGSGTAWTGRGIAPDILSDAEGDVLLNEARKHLEELIQATRTVQVMPKT